MTWRLPPRVATLLQLAILPVLFLTALPAAAAAQGALTNGGNHAGAISAPGEIDEWTFSAAAGEVMLLRIGETLPAGPDPGFWPRIQLYNPSGTLVDSSYNALAAEVSGVAGLAGTYTARVSSADGGNDALGSYVLRFVKVPGTPTVPSGDEGGALTNGANHAGHIDVGDLDVWTFTADQGQAAILRIGEVLPAGPDPGLLPSLRVYGPTGVYVDGSYNNLAAEVGFQVPLTGTYTVVVATSDGGLDAEGDYLLRFVKAPGTFSDEDGRALTNGGNHAGHIGIGDLDVWTFTANQGHAAILRIGEVLPPGPDPGFLPSIRVYGPTGTFIDGSYNNLAAEVGFQAPLTGTYTVVVATSDGGLDAEGDYLLRFIKVPGTFSDEDGGALTNGDNHAGHIGIGDLDVWTFTVNQDEAALIRIGEVPVGPTDPDPGFLPSIRVYGPTGTFIDGSYNNLAAEVGFQAPLTGTYTVVVATSDGGLDAEGDYLLRLAKMPGAFTVPDGDQGGALTNGANHPGRIEIGDLDMWSFTANQNEAAIIRIGEVVPAGPDPGFLPSIRVYGPTGTFIDGSYNNLAAEVGFQAPLTGTYTVVVATSDGGLDAVGDYVLRLVKIPGTFSDENGGVLTNGANHAGRIQVGDLDVWTFTANQNEGALIRIGEVPVDATDPDPGFWPSLRVYGPTGAFIEGSYNDRAAEVGFYAPLTGTYTVVVGTSDGGLDAEGNYLLRFAKMPGPFTVPVDDHGGALTNGVSHPGRIEIGDLDLWSFQACSGNSLVLTINEVPVGPGDPDPGFYPWIRLYNSLGSLVSGGSAYGNTLAQINHTVIQPGSFTVVVGSADGGYDATGDYTVRVQVTGGACGVPTTVADNFSTAVNATLTIPAPGVLGNDSTNGGGPMTAELMSAATAGTVALNGNGSFTYAPPAGFTGTASFTYRAANAFGAGNTVLVTLAVTQGPTTVADAYGTPINTPLTIPAPGVLGNDNSNGGGAMTAQLVSTVTTGTLSLDASGSFTFTPPTGFIGATSFAYRAVNAGGTGNTVAVTLTVQAGLPTTANDAFSTSAGTPLNVAAPGVLGNDNSNGGGALSAQVVSTTTNGILTLFANGSLSYTPNTGFSGVDSFTYRAVNSAGPGNLASVTIDVGTVPTGPQPPTALYAASIAGNTVTLRFTAPITGPTPTGYLLEGGVAPGQVLASIPTGSVDPIYTVVAPSGSFYVRMHTLAGGARSEASNEILIHVNAPVPPSAPANLTGTVNNSSIALAWRNTFGGGAPGNVILDVTGDLSASLPLGLTESFQFDGVPGGTYTLSVRAANGSGSSPSSNPITLQFPSPCSGAPLPPSNFLAYRTGNTINVLWDPAATGPAPTAFVLNVTGTFGGSFGTPGRGLSGVVGPGTYHLSVAAQNSCGGSAATTVQTVVVP